MTPSQTSLEIVKANTITNINQTIKSENDLLTFLMKDDSVSMPLNISKLKKNIDNLQSFASSVEKVSSLEDFFTLQKSFFKKVDKN